MADGGAPGELPEVPAAAVRPGHAAGVLSIAWCAAATGLGLAAQHPLAPWVLICGLCLVMAWAAWRPSTIGFVLAAALPVAGWAPWTGWWLVDEFDLLVLAVLAGGYGRWGLDILQRRWVAVRTSRVWDRLVVALAVSGFVSLVLGLRDAGVGIDTVTAAWSSGDWMTRAQYADHDSAFNALRVSKSILWAVLCYPLMRRLPDALRLPSARLTAAGLTMGLCLVIGLVLWERLRYVGVFSFTESYRTVAAFWEMHVGGGAIDAYLAMAAPLAFWAVWLSPVGWRWGLAALLALGTTYAVLTTYSRGLYGAVLVGTACMAFMAWRFGIRPRDGGRRRGVALAALLIALLAESIWVLSGPSAMAGRLARTETDLMERINHWRDGIALVQPASQWWLGLGAGRLPARYSAQVPGGEFPGRAQWQRRDSGVGQVVLSGPAARQDIAHDFALTQKVDLAAQGNYRVRLRYQSDAPLVFLLSVCERHLLYDVRCQWRHVRPQSAVVDGGLWHEIALRGPGFKPVGRAMAWRDGMFAVTVLTAGQSMRLHAVELLDPSGRQVLRNTDFAVGLRHWLPVAQGQFKPWHMDNLYLEALIERGALGALVLFLLGAWGARCILDGLRAREPLALALAGSWMSMAALGLVISVMELPRIAFMLLLILLTTSQLRRIPQYSRPVTDCN
ncbi:MAG: hypothetical protein C4535_09640 [Comamonadaceae bacterium]|nr:MAG: hypothetical protein C4535_09640 [Comamonadaceae bacterium]